MRALSLLFPAEPRAFRGRRGVKIALRALHVLCAGVFTAAHVLAVDPARRGPWLAGTIASGALILLLDLFESGAFLLQVRGLVVMAKIGLLLALPTFGEYQPHVLVVILLTSVVFSHAPSKVRYFVVLGDMRGAETKG